MGLFGGEHEGEAAEERAADREGDDEGVGGAVHLLQHGHHDAEREEAAHREDGVEDLGPLGELLGIVKIELVPLEVQK